MRIAIIVAQTEKGLSTVILSSDLDAVRARFRDIRTLGSLKVDGGDALCAWYFDTSGRQLRKFLAPEASVDVVDAANGAELSRRQAQAQADERVRADLETARKAHELANVALEVVAKRIAGGVSPVVVAPAVVVDAAPAAVEAPADDQPADELAASDDPFTEVAPKSPRPPKKK